LVWIKERDATSIPVIYDTERGVGKLLRTNDTNAETDLSASSLGITAYNSNGFSLGGTTNNDNDSGINHASWTFRKAPKFFDVVTYTGNGSTQNISHNLGSVPGTIIVKKTNSTANWLVYHRSLGNDKALFLNLNSSQSSSTTYWNATTPTDSVFSVGANSNTNGNGDTFVAYLFAHNDGDGDFGSTADQDIIKCGSYTGNASTNTVNLGFEPQIVIIKPYTHTGNWEMYDTMRGFARYGDKPLYANLANAEGAAYPGDYLAPTPTGFELNQNWSSNTNGYGYIYIAIRRGPMAVPESATDVFDIDTRNSTGTGVEPGYRSSSGVVDFALRKNSASGTDNWQNMARLIQGKFLEPNTTDAEATGAEAMFDYMNGYKATVGTNAGLYSWMWKRAPSFFDVVAYTGTGTARTVSHNLGVPPEMIWFKSRSNADNWVVYVPSLGNKKLYLNLTNAVTNAGGGDFNDTAPTSTVFSVGDGTDTNRSGGTHIAYLFASLDGVSKVGSFTYSGTTLNVDCGFSNGARFVLYKRYNTTGSWLVLDTERGINASANDPVLYLNATDAEDSGYNLIEPYSAGFTISGNDVGNGDYIFYAIA